jgi:hypothetical protein
VETNWVVDMWHIIVVTITQHVAMMWNVDPSLTHAYSMMTRHLLEDDWTIKIFNCFINFLRSRTTKSS